MSYFEDEPPPVLLPCTICSRTFRPEVLERHVKVCEKSATKKRRVFDSFKNRVSGTELEEFLGPAPLPGQVQKRPVKSPVKKKGPPKWKETHENLIAVLRAARGVEPPPDTVVEAPKPAGNEQCPSCNRFFGPRAFDRHVEFCKEKTARIKMTPSKVSQAQERLEARTKYRAPLSIKPKLTTKEKYSPMLPRKESTESCIVSSSSKTSPPVPALSRNTKTVKQNSSNFSRQSPIRSSERQRSISPTKKGVSNSKSSIKNEIHAKSTNQPKIKENSKGHDDLRPKTGTKNSTQEKIRSSYIKLSQLEDETPANVSKSKNRTREKSLVRSNLHSDKSDESSVTVENEANEKKNKFTRRKWSSAESISRINPKAVKLIQENPRDDEKLVLKENDNDNSKVKSKKKNKQKLQINDLSVNDGSFGIVVAACTVRPPSSSTSKANVKLSKESLERHRKERVGSNSSEDRRNLILKELSEKSKKEKLPSGYSEENKFLKESPKKNKKSEVVTIIQEKSKKIIDFKPDRVTEIDKKHSAEPKAKNPPSSRIPKARPDICHKFTVRKPEPPTSPLPVTIESLKEPFNLENETENKIPDVSELCVDKDVLAEKTSDIKKKAKKWLNISEMSTEELLEMSKDFEVPDDSLNQDLSESAIWDIAAEQFLKSEESIHTSSILSIDSLNESQVPKDPEEKISGKGGDDFIVLHVADPSKLIEHDADMKLSLSDPCFSYSEKFQKHKSEQKSENKNNDIVVFTAFPSSIQPRIYHRKVKKPKKSKPRKNIPKLPQIREKTFLANDFPKTKRRRVENPEAALRRLIDFSDYFFEKSSKKEFNERKKKFIEGLKSQRDKIREWQKTANSHMRFMEEFQKSIEEDLKELKILSKGKKPRRKSSMREFSKEKLKNINNSNERTKNLFEEKLKMETQTKAKKFEYFEIDLQEGKEDIKDVKKNNTDVIGNVVQNEAVDTTENLKVTKKVELKEVVEKNTRYNDILDLNDKVELYKNVESEENIDVNEELCKIIELGEKLDLGGKIECSESDEVLDNLEIDGSIEPRLVKEEDPIVEEYETRGQNRKKFECFEISLDDFVKKPKKGSKKDKPKRFEEIKLNEILDLSEEKENEEDCSKLIEKSLELFGSESTDFFENERESLDEDSVQVVGHQNNSLENIEEVDEEEEKDTDEKSLLAKDIVIEDFILLKPDTQKILLKEENCLDQLFPKTRQIAGNVISLESTTAVPLGFTTDSVYDLKLTEENQIKILPALPTKGNSSRILQKRLKKGSHLPKISAKDQEKKENSMISLLELWQNKREKMKSEKVLKSKMPLPNGKLAPLSNKNSLQIKNMGDDSYDPFKQAERQMLALMSWPSTADMKSTKDLSPKPKSSPSQKSNLETSPTSAFTKYPNKDEAKPKTAKLATISRKSLNETFDVNEISNKNNNNKNEKPTYTSADDWEEIFEKHFDLNRNEMSEQMTKSMKSALDGILKNSIKNNSNLSGEVSPTHKNKSDFIENSIITEVLYTSTPKQNSKSDKNKSRSKGSSLEQELTPNTYRKSSNFNYGRITPPEDFNDSLEKNKKEEKTNRNSGVSLSSLSFCSQISDTTLADEEVMRSNLEIIGKAAAAAAAKTPRRKYARSQSVFDERNKMLFAKTYDPNLSSSDENDVEILPKIVDKQGKKSPTRNPYPKPVPSHFSRSQSVMEDRFKGDGDHSDGGDCTSPPESSRNRKAKLSGDSAYSSLNRRSPRPSKLNNQQEDRLSSSGSDHSLSTLNNDFNLKPKSLDFDKPTLRKDQPVKMSKFCHECGSKYPVAVAKFCCECGVRRLII